MADVPHVCMMRLEFEHIKQDMVDIKATAKEQSKDMLLMRDSHTETKIYIKQIQESQNTMAQETKANQVLMMKGIQDIRDEPIKDLKHYKMIGWTFAITWVLSNAFGLIKTFAPKLIGQ